MNKNYYWKFGEEEGMNIVAPEFEDMELSTQLLIGEALKRDVQVEILDKKDSFLRLSKGDKVEYVKQATRTSVDNYIAPLIMENKLITKTILGKNDIQVPQGKMFDSPQDAIASYIDFAGRDIVVKPKSTNFGIGITIIKSLQSEKEYQVAIDEAFSFDRSILVEEFIEGKEYRFLIIADEVVGVLHRVAANVVGDGKSTIFDLVERKNRDPLRGIGYKKPLEQIRLGSAEKSYLLQQSKSFSAIPVQGEQVFLRKNSNISTGGDSIDFTDEMAKVYKDIAIKAANVVGAKICGADLIISGSITDPDIKNLLDNYSVIELNFNPAIHIHGYPHLGINRKAEVKILNLLGF